MLKIISSLALFSIFLFLGCSNNSDILLADKAGAPLLNGLGKHSHRISSNVDGVQRYFDQGLIMAFASNHAESIRSFKAAPSLDPNCAK